MKKLGGQGSGCTNRKLMPIKKRTKIEIEIEKILLLYRLIQQILDMQIDGLGPVAKALSPISGAASDGYSGPLWAPLCPRWADGW